MRETKRHRVRWSAVVVTAAMVLGVMGFTALPAAATVTYYYASPTGTGDCLTISTPCSLQSAQNKVRSATAGQTDHLVVWLLGGTYYLNSSYTCTDTNSVFYQTATMCLDDAPSTGGSDSGHNGYYVYYQSYPGQTAVISGGVPIASNAWTFDSSTGLFKTTLSDTSLWRARQIYVNGVRSRRAWGLVYEAPLWAQTGTPVSGGYTKSGTLPWSPTSSWNFGNCAQAVSDCDIETVAYNADWTWRCPSSYVDDATHSMYMKTECWQVEKDTAFTTEFPNAGPAFVENAYELLLDSDNTGEFYINQHAGVSNSGTLYYRARPGEHQLVNGVDTLTASVVVPKLDTVVGMQGRSATQPVHNIQMIGITFADTSWNTYGVTASTNAPISSGAPGANPQCTPAHGTVASTCDASPDYGYIANHGWYSSRCAFIDTTITPNRCAGPKYSVMPQAGVMMTRSAAIILSQDTFTRMGGVGAEFTYGVDNNPVGSFIQQSTFTDISSMAIVAGGVSSYVCPTTWTNGVGFCNVGSTGTLGGDPGDALANIHISNNSVYHVGVEYTDAPAILETFAHNPQINSNTIHDAPYCGICSGSTNGVDWPTEQENLDIDSNNIYDVFTMTADGGAIDVFDNNAGCNPAACTANYNPPHTAKIHGNVMKDIGSVRPGWFGAMGQEAIDLEYLASFINVYGNSATHMYAAPGADNARWIVMGGHNDVAGKDLAGNLVSNYSDNTTTYCDANPTWSYCTDPTNYWGRAVLTTEPQLQTGALASATASSAYDQPNGQYGGTYAAANGKNGSELQYGWVSNPCPPATSPSGQYDHFCTGAFGPYWTLNLGGPHVIQRVRFTSMGDHDSNHQRDFEILASNDNFATYVVLGSVNHDGFGWPTGPIDPAVTNYGGSAWDFYTNNSNQYQWLMVVKTTTAPVTFAMNELEVYAG
jgi:hypothetical protein